MNVTETIYDRLTGPEIILNYASFQKATRTAAGIVEGISRETMIPVRDILSKKRTRPVAHARQDAMLSLRENLDWPLSKIGKLFGRDHTTVVHSIRAAAARRDADK